LDGALGPQHWWPGESVFEIIVGAILTQSTAWTNVEKAIANLKRARILSARAMARLRLKTLAEHIRPSGYFNQKALRLKVFLAFLGGYGSLRSMLREPTEALRQKLLSLHGVGPETADSILLYAARRPIFVVDAYTRRILTRHGWIHEHASYEEIQRLFHSRLPSNTPMFNQYHALLVNVGKNFCRRREPRCRQCPLEPMLPIHHKQDRLSRLPRK
jgi:endonuclease-3 related protein